MKNVTYFNAGAGSGKTYTLTQKLVELIRNGVNPEQVILTTFTTKAADEFKEKAKAELYKESMYDEAARLDQAMIGTVHSVCERFIGKYWFYLGLAPNMDVMAEDDTQYYLSQSLAELPTDEELKVLHDYCKFFEIRERKEHFLGGLDYDFWQSQLKRIIEFTTNYEIDDYSISEKKSLELVRGLVDKSVSVDISDTELSKVLEEVTQYVQRPNKGKNKEEKIQTFKDIIKRQNHRDISWYKSFNKNINAKYGPVSELCKEKLSKIWQSTIVYDRQEEYIRLMFELAKRWKERFSVFKRDRNLLDFSDMEKYMHKLIKNPELAAQIKQSYKYLFVDEFQDSSPIQVKIFDALSDLMEHSFWVGDYKQAIYGFRGSDVELVKSVVDSLPSKIGCNIETLDTCYRSLPDIVEVNNAVYTKTFKGVLDYDRIHLNSNRTNDGNIDNCRYVIMKGQEGISAYVLQLIEEGASPNEIAVLARTNDELDTVANSLKSYNIPVTRASQPMSESRTFQLVASLLRIINSDNDTLAKATVAFMTETGYDISKIIDEKLLHDIAQGKPGTFLSKIPLIAKLTELKPKLKQQSIASMVESMIIELDLFNITKRLKDSSFGASYLQMIINTAKIYEEHSIQMDLPATIKGFIDYIDTINPTGNGNQNGVQLHTYHSAKGLEWKYVILTSLNTHPADEQKLIRQEICGVHFNHVKEPSTSNPYPEMYIRLTPWIYGSAANTKLPDVLYPLITGLPLFESSKKSILEEANRLMYVGMTRAKDVLLFYVDVEEKKGSKNNPLQWFKDIGLESAGDLSQVKAISPQKKAWDVLGVGKMFSDYTIPQDLESLPAFETDENEPMQDMACIHPDTEKKPFIPKHVSPSEVDGKGKVLAYKQIGERIPFGERPSDMAIVGNCIHQIFAVVENLPACGINLDEIIKSYELESVLVEPNAIICAWENLKNWLTKEFGEAIRTYHERSFRMERGGQLIVGSIDFVWETDNGAVLIDFKTCPMGEKQILNEDSEHYAGLYAGQLNAYTDALVSAGEKVLKRFIYYPVNGIIAEIGY